MDAETLRAENEALKAELAAMKGVKGQVSPLAPKVIAEAQPVAGVTLASIAAGVRYKGRDDVMLARLEPGTAMAGVFTRSSTRSAPVLACEASLARHAKNGPDGKPIGIIVNSGNSNAFTGAAGEESVRAVTRGVASLLGTEPESVYMASTGVIGERLPHDRIEAALEALVAGLAPDCWLASAKAIMTTDTFPKLSSASARIDGVPVTISGFTKGSGMIAPDMATMLGFVFTDAKIEQAALQELLSRETEGSFNAITVDGDTSTSDSVLFAATGMAEHALISDSGDARLRGFRLAFRAVMRDLAQQIIRDGEGATKFIEVQVNGAESDESAKVVALSIANSPLVKTAFAGEDPNWGRIVMAVGKSGQPADRDALTIYFGDVLVAEKGWVAARYREEDGAAYMKGEELTVTVDMGIGTGSARVWTCDLTHRYIAINADYRS